MLRNSLALTFLLVSAPVLAQDVLRGHGGPVRALAVAGAARELVSGSFDSTVIVWDLDRSTAKRVLRFHEGPVNAVAVLPGGCIASGGADRRVAIWCGDGDKPKRVLEGHDAPVTGLAVHQGRLASSSFDGTVRLWDYTGTRPAERVVEHPSPVMAVAAEPERELLAVAGSDGSIIHINRVVALKTSLTTAIAAVRLAPDGEIVASFADGHVRFIALDYRDAPRSTSTGERQVRIELDVAADLEVDTIPLSSLALSPDGSLIATAGLRGGIAIIDRASRTILHRLTGPGLPVWSLAFDSDNRTLFSGGADRVIRRWDAVAGKPLTSTVPERDAVAEAAANGERGAVVFRACQACHTLSPDDGNRAGPTLHGVFGRSIGKAPGYVYSQALPAMQIVWGKETIARLFEVGPAAYTPGTKMPEQTIDDPADREALVDWLERVTSAQK